MEPTFDISPGVLPHGHRERHAFPRAGSPTSRQNAHFVKSRARCLISRRSRSRCRIQMAKTHSFAVTGPSTAARSFRPAATSRDSGQVGDCPIILKAARRLCGGRHIHPSRHQVVGPVDGMPLGDLASRWAVTSRSGAPAAVGHHQGGSEIGSGNSGGGVVRRNVNHFRAWPPIRTPFCPPISPGQAAHP